MNDSEKLQTVLEALRQFAAERRSDAADYQVAAGSYHQSGDWRSAAVALVDEDEQVRMACEIEEIIRAAEK